MHRPRARDVEHAAIDVGMIVTRRGEGNNSLIKLEALREMRCGDRNATLERCAVRREHMHARRLKFPKKILRLLMRFRNDCERMTS